MSLGEFHARIVPVSRSGQIRWPCAGSIFQGRGLLLTPVTYQISELN